MNKKKIIIGRENIHSRRKTNKEFVCKLICKCTYAFSGALEIGRLEELSLSY